MGAESQPPPQPVDHRDRPDRRVVKISAGLRLRAALVLAVVADVAQMIVFPLFMEGAASPADDLIDLCIGGALTALLGWHWEFLPSFAAKLVPGLDLAPLWTLAVANVYRKSRALAATIEGETLNPGTAGRSKS
jgi:hypothetical protein